MKFDIKTFLYYNWWKILISVMIIAGIVFSFCQCSSKVESDFGVLYISENEIADSETFRNAAVNTGVIEDADGKDGTNIVMREIYIPESAEVMHQQRVPEQIRLELVSGECTLYILDRETVYENEVFDIFYDMRPLAEKYGIDDEKLYISKTGTACAISLEGNSFLNSSGAPCDSLYLAIKNHKNTDDIRIKNAVSFAEYILKNQ